MKQLGVYLRVIILLGLTATVNADSLFSLTGQKLTVCQQPSIFNTAPDFSQPGCESDTFYNLDPQGKSIWVELTFDTSPQLLKIEPPLGLYLMAKASSRVFLNGQPLGQNGIPATQAKMESPGKLDAVFYLPVEYLNQQTNTLHLQLSTHNSYVNLGHPMHYIAIGEYGSANRFSQPYNALGLGLFGVFLVSALYFGALSFNAARREKSLLLMTLSITASLQLLSEISRALFQYDYPMHDVRLLLITFFSWGFGFCLLVLISRQFSSRSVHWIYSGLLITLIGLLFIESFDAKTALATLVPSFLSTLMIGLRLKQQFSWHNLGYFLVFLTFTVTIIVTFSYFHELVYYLLIAALLCYLMIQQAKEFNLAQTERQKEQQQIAKLEYKLAQSRQQHTAEHIQINSSGKMERVAINDILYCQASGDYVELHLISNRQLLFSGSLKKLAELMPANFIKVHRSYLVNLDCIRALKSDSGNGQLILTNDNTIPVSRRMMPRVRETISEGSKNE